VAGRFGGLPRPPGIGPPAVVTGSAVTGPAVFTPAVTGPSVTRPSATGRALAGPSEPTSSPGPVDSDALFAAVSRTDDMLTGLLVGMAMGTGATATVVSIGGGWPGRLLALAAAGSFAFRARTYAAARHRAAMLVTAGLASLPLLAIGTIVGTGGLFVAA